MNSINSVGDAAATTSSAASIVSAIAAFATQTIPILQWLALLVSVVSGMFAIVWWIRKFRNRSK